MTLAKQTLHKPFTDPASPRHGGQSRSIMSCGHDTGDSPRYHGSRFCLLGHAVPSTRKSSTSCATRCRTSLRMTQDGHEKSPEASGCSPRGWVCIDGLWLKNKQGTASALPLHPAAKAAGEGTDVTENCPKLHTTVAL
jgi:hypothetical protein